MLKKRTLTDGLLLTCTIGALLGLAASATLAPALTQTTSPPPAIAAAAGTEALLQQAAKEAVGEDATKAAAAIASLRAAGYAGLDAMAAVNAPVLSQGSIGGQVSPATARARRILDQIAGQKDASFSKLYWYTDFAAAKAAAAKENKPILSLHLLGKLSEDLSCANSRFFRTTLYPNAAIGAYLRQNFILHWQSERPVPVVTIDFGDGRKIVRTLTGNSIHYILDSRGRLVDALPGLYGPAAFLRGLEAAEAEARQVAGFVDGDCADMLEKYHAAEARSIHESFVADLKSAGLSPDGSLTDADWEKIAALHPQDAQLDAGAIRAMRGKIPAAVAMRVTASKLFVEDPIMRMVRNVQGSIGIDTVKNEYLLHETIAQWLSQPNGSEHPPELTVFNTRVYAQLFLTPQSDPWIGLAPPDVYSAIDNGGEEAIAAK